MYRAAASSCRGDCIVYRKSGRKILTGRHRKPGRNKLQPMPDRYIGRGLQVMHAADIGRQDQLRLAGSQIGQLGRAQAFRQLRSTSSQRVSVEMGLVGVIGTQLWHHLYIDGSLGPNLHFNDGMRDAVRLIFAPRTIVNADPPMPSQINPNVPAAMDTIIRRALEKDLYSRYRNGAEMAQDLSSVRYQIVDDNWVALDTSRLEILKRLEFFQGFEEVELWEVLRISTWREIAPDTLLMREGAEEAGFGILIEGEVEVSVEERAICRLGVGEVVGEMAYLNQDAPRRCATVVTLTPVTYLEVNNAALALATEECFQRFQKKLVATAIRRLAAADHSLASHGEAAHKPAAVDTLEAADQRLRHGEHGLARRNRRRIGGDFVHTAEEIVEGGGQAGAAIAQQAVHLANLVGIGIQFRESRLCGHCLVREELVVDALHRRHVGALAEITGAGELRRVRALDDLLAVEAGRGGIADVVAGRQQARLGRRQSRYADIEYARAHVRSRFQPLTALIRKTCVIRSDRCATSGRR